MSLFKAIERLIKAGFPESTAKKIVTGELPMDFESRMGRAMDQGYDVDRRWYHGTSKDILEFDPSQIGKGPGATPAMLPQGFYFARKPDEASEYATGEGANILPVYLNTQDTITRGGINAFKDFNQGVGDSLITRSEDVMVVRNPEQIRSMSAAFDPDQVGNPNLLASAAPVAAGGILGALGATGSGQAEASPRMMRNVSEGIQANPNENMIGPNAILEALMGFLAPQTMGDATMDAYNRSRIR